MLVLTRKLQEQIVIGNDIKVTILRVKGNTVRLGIEAPRQVRVVRAELPPEAASANSAEAPPARESRDPSAAASRAPSASRASDQISDSGIPRCPPPLAAYLVSLSAHAS